MPVRDWEGFLFLLKMDCNGETASAEGKAYLSAFSLGISEAEKETELRGLTSWKGFLK